MDIDHCGTQIHTLVISDCKECKYSPSSNSIKFERGNHYPGRSNMKKMIDLPNARHTDNNYKKLFDKRLWSADKSCWQMKLTLVDENQKWLPSRCNYFCRGNRLASATLVLVRYPF